MGIKLKNFICTACELSKHRRNMVIGRGSIPADALFLGEAPGESEDTIGEAFVGKSGKMLDEMVLEACRNQPVPSYFISNAVLCRPWVWDKDM